MTEREEELRRCVDVVLHLACFYANQYEEAIKIDMPDPIPVIYKETNLAYKNAAFRMASDHWVYDRYKELHKNIYNKVPII